MVRWNRRGAEYCNARQPTLGDHPLRNCDSIHPGLSHEDYMRRMRGEEPEEEEGSEEEGEESEEGEEEENLTPRGVPYRQSKVNESPHLQVLGRTPASRFWLQKV